MHCNKVCVCRLKDNDTLLNRGYNSETQDNVSVFKFFEDYPAVKKLFKTANDRARLSQRLDCPY